MVIDSGVVTAFNGMVTAQPVVKLNVNRSLTDQITTNWRNPYGCRWKLIHHDKSEHPEWRFEAASNTGGGSSIMRLKARR
jgi:hypothetical protein